MAVRVGAPKKSTGCGSLGAGILLLVLVLAVLLMLLGLLPNPLDPKPTPTSQPTAFINLPSAVPEATPTWTIAPSQTQAPAPTDTPAPTPTFTLTPTEKPMPYVLRGKPTGYPNAMLFPQYACEKYLFVGGEVWDLREAPVYGLTVKLGGKYGETTIDLSSVSGDVAVYGKSGFGFVIDNKRIKENNIFIQLFDENGEPLSAPTYLSISGNCDSNLIIVNYKQVREIQP